MHLLSSGNFPAVRRSLCLTTLLLAGTAMSGFAAEPVGGSATGSLPGQHDKRAELGYVPHVFVRWAGPAGNPGSTTSTPNPGTSGPLLGSPNPSYAVPQPSSIRWPPTHSAANAAAAWNWWFSLIGMKNSLPIRPAATARQRAPSRGTPFAGFATSVGLRPPAVTHPATLSHPD